MRLDWRGALGLALSAALLWWTLRDVDLASVASHLREANLPLLLLAAALATACLLVRVPRWKTILAPIDEHLDFGPLWRATAIGTMVNNVVPARVGELARAFALSRERPSIPFSASFASLAVDRVFDAVAVMLLMAVAIADPSFPRGHGDVTTRVANTIGLGTVFAVLLLAMLYLLVFLPERIIRLYERITRRLAPALEARGRDALLAFASGLGVLRHPLRFTAVFAWTVAFWMLNALAFWLGFRAVGIHVSYTAALLVQGVIVVGVAIPQAPGFWGVFEAAAKFALVDVYGVPAGQAVSWAIGFHLLSFLPITLIGAWYFVRLGLHFRELGAAQGNGEAGTPDRGRAA
ncbi:MAG TPA: lysylphosphatidylglycerol synthase transmembrane domain-containing protein [Gemmatimonadaceae bacterium]|nr:lysylphosphatidylglycerol synthase transmembrane domain-containing protein [Gemmatimonadaceae bacterium]